MKQALYFIIVLALAMLFIPGVMEESELKFLGINLTTWVGGIGIIVLCVIALTVSKHEIKTSKQKRVSKSKKDK